MKRILDASQMKKIDEYSIETIKIPSVVLMEEAARSVVKCVKSQVEKDARIVAICGTGNNGADGIAVARILHEEGYQTEIYLIGNKEHATKEWKLQLEIAKNLQVPFTTKLEGSTVIIDAIFGIGLSREVVGDYAKLIEQINALSALVVSVDIASGVHASTGKIMGVAIKADYTVTFGYSKIGMNIYPGKEYSGLVFVEDIGFPAVSLKQVGATPQCIEDSDLSILSSLRPPNSHKGTFGKVLVIAGSENMAGAAVFSAKSAYRMGSGLVKVYTPKENRIIIQNLVPEAILSTYKSDVTKKAILEELSWASVVVLGPGFGRDKTAKKITEIVVKNCKVPLVMDADALRNLAEIENYKKLLKPHMILTPHMGELAALTNLSVSEVIERKLELVKSFPCTCIAKDASSVIGNEKGELYINTSGCSALATAGSGDVLTGIIAGLLSYSVEPTLAAAMGVFIHGRVGERAGKELGEASVIATDLINFIGEIIK